MGYRPSGAFLAVDGPGLAELASRPNRRWDQEPAADWLAPGFASPEEYARRQDRTALAAGHPVTWGLITKGTCLEKSSYSDGNVHHLKRYALTGGGQARRGTLLRK
jgi:hypothetical protein